MENKTLYNGVSMPPIGFGVFQISDLRVCRQAVEDAIDVGCRLIAFFQGIGGAKKTLLLSFYRKGISVFIFQTADPG